MSAIQHYRFSGTLRDLIENHMPQKTVFALSLGTGYVFFGNKQDLLEDIPIIEQYMMIMRKRYINDTQHKLKRTFNDAQIERLTNIRKMLIQSLSKFVPILDRQVASLYDNVVPEQPTRYKIRLEGNDHGECHLYSEYAKQRMNYINAIKRWGDKFGSGKYKGETM